MSVQIFFEGNTILIKTLFSLIWQNIDVSLIKTTKLGRNVVNQVVVLTHVKHVDATINTSGNQKEPYKLVSSTI
jgi:hypothetical protein